MQGCVGMTGRRAEAGRRSLFHAMKALEAQDVWTDCHFFSGQTPVGVCCVPGFVARDSEVSQTGVANMLRECLRDRGSVRWRNCATWTGGQGRSGKVPREGCPGWIW